MPPATQATSLAAKFICFIEINQVESFEWPNQPYPERANLG